MGTKALLAICGSEGKPYKRIVGMGYDGLPGSLKQLSEECMEIAQENGILDSFCKKEEDAVFAVMDALVERHPQWLFCDDVNNARLLKYRGVFDPGTRKLKVNCLDSLLLFNYVI